MSAGMAGLSLRDGPRRRICFPFVGETVGGSHLSTLLLIRSLRSSRFEPVIVLHRQDGLSAHLEENEIPYHRLPIRGVLHGGPSAGELARRLAALLWPVIDFIRRQKIDAVHANDLRCNQTWAIPCRLAAAPLIWHQRTKFAPSRLTQLTMQLASRIVCNSEFCRSTLPDRFRSRAEVVVNPFDTTEPAPDRAAARRMILAAAGRPEAAHVIGFCGTLSRQKRPEGFIEAAAAMRSRLPGRALFVLIGPDRDGRLAELRGLTQRAGVQADVFFAGFRHPAAAWLAGLDVLFAPQIDDAFGRTLIEAMLVGTPVVATDTGGHRDIVRHGVTGLLVPGDDAGAAADACLRLALDGDMAERLSRSAMEHARSSYGVVEHAEAMARIYDAALAA